MEESVKVTAAVKALPAVNISKRGCNGLKYRKLTLEVFTMKIFKALT